MRKHKNIYAGKCEHCGIYVPAYAGYRDKIKDGIVRNRLYHKKYRFFVVCKECAKTKMIGYK